MIASNIMFRLISLFCAAVLAIPNLVAARPHNCSTEAPSVKTVDLGYAKFLGSTNGLGISEFLGMRFAAPSLGDLRFRAPRDPLPENGTVKANTVSLSCARRRCLV